MSDVNSLGDFSEDDITSQHLINSQVKDVATDSKKISLVAKPSPKLSDSIKDNNWLEGSDLDRFGERVVTQHTASNVYAFANFYLYQWIAHQNYPSCLSYLHMLNTKNHYAFFVPFITSFGQGPENHWCLACVFFSSKTILFIDSKRRTTDKYYRQYFFRICELVNLVVHSADKSMAFEHWRLVVDSECYQQKNDYDCGTFVCLYMYSIINGDYDYVNRLKKNKRNIVRRVIDEVPAPPQQHLVHHAYKGWMRFPDMNYTFAKGSKVISQFQSALKNIKCSICLQKIEGEKQRCIACNNEAHQRCLNEDNRLCECKLETTYSSQNSDNDN